MTVILAADQQGSSSLLDEHQVFLFLVQLALLVGAARFLGGVANKLGQPPVVGQLLGGVVIGPSVLGQIYPETFDWIFSDSTVESVLYGVAWLAVIMVLVVIGYETDLGIISRLRRAAVNVSAGALLVPLVAVGLVALLTPSSFVGTSGRGLYAAFMALALSVAALPVVAKILLDLGMLRRNFGQVTLAVSMTMDSVGWLILAGLAGIAQEGFEPAQLLTALGGLVVFVALAATVGRWLLNQAMRLALRGGANLEAALTVGLVAAIGGGAVTHALGLEAILGAFIVGIILATLRYQMVEVRHVLETITDSFFAPVFFAFSGLRVDISLLASPSAIIWTVALIVLAVAAKMFGTLVGARRAGLTVKESLALGSGLSALGAMGIVVALVGLSLGVLSDTGYTVIVLAAIVTSLLAPVLLKVSVRGMEAEGEEKARLESEAIRSQAHILGSQRILLPTRGGANSVFAASQIGRLFKSAEVTVLEVSGSSGGWWKRLIGKEVEVETGPEAAIRALEGEEHRLIRRRARDPADAILKEADLGYDLVVLGAPGKTGETEVFSTVIDRVLARLQVPALIFRYPELQAELSGGDMPEVRRVLLSVEANPASRAAAEVAYSLAAHNDGMVFALHLINETADGPYYFDMKASAENFMAGRDLVEESVEYGQRLGARVHADVRPVAQPEGELADTANSEDWDLLVVGAANRPLTNRPFFGYGMSFVLKHVTIPLVIVAIPAPSHLKALR
ncbi:MAG: cation:proton antiporter [bacterium]|nr:cation:proton antiporter [bacterium]MDE0601282.1 cation:proton antiporter [bacterium]